MSDRHRFLFMGALGLVAVLVLSACDWAQLRYGPAHTGFNPFETTISPANVTGLGLRWSEPASTGRPIYAPPTIANGVLYVGSDKLYAFDASTGGARWSQKLGLVVDSAPAIDHGVVYVGSTDSKLYAFDASSGTARWSQTVGRIVSSPTIANGVVYVAADKLDAFNATTGTQLWSAATGSNLDVSLDRSPAVANGVVCSDRRAIRSGNVTTHVVNRSRATARDAHDTSGAQA